MTPHRMWAAAFIAAALVPSAVAAENTIKIGFPMPLSGPASVYGVPITKGAEMAVAGDQRQGRRARPQARAADARQQGERRRGGAARARTDHQEQCRLPVGTLTSAEAPAVSTIAKENKIVFIAPTSKTIQLTSPANLHPYIFRLASNTDIDGRTGAAIIAQWKEVKKVATIAPDYAYGRDAVGAFVEFIKKARPDIEIVDQQWPKLGQSRLHALHHRADGQEAGRGVLRRVRRRLRHARQAGGPARLFQGDQQSSGRRRRGRDDRRGAWRSAPTIPTASGPMPTIR